MSYTTFDYSDLHVAPVTASGDSVNVTLTLRNSGSCDGYEVAQLYLHDRAASVAQPQMALRAFEKVYLKAGESRQVTFCLGFDELSIINREMRRVVEPGTFDVFVGASSQDIRLKGEFTVK